MWPPPEAAAGSWGGPPVHLVVDSSTCLDPAGAAEAGVSVVPLHIVCDGRSHRDMLDLLPTEFYRSLREGVGIHSTSAPSTGDYLSAFQQAPGDVLCLTCAASITSMFQAASLAAEMAAEEGRRVEVVDTGTAAGGLRLLTLRAARLAAEGRPAGEIARAIRDLSRRVRIFGALETIEFLARSGRVPQVASLGARALGVRPVVRFARGRGGLVQLARGPDGARRALERILARRAEKDGAGPDGERLVATVFHADAIDEARLLAERLEERFPRADLSISEFTPAMGVHTGPGLVGHAFFVDPPEPPQG